MQCSECDPCWPRPGITCLRLVVDAVLHVYLFVLPHSDTLCVSCAFVVFLSSAGCISGCEFPFPVSSPGASPLPDDLCVVFVVELDKGPYGLGMGLIDGLVSVDRRSNTLQPFAPFIQTLQGAHNKTKVKRVDDQRQMRYFTTRFLNTTIFKEN